MYSSTPQFNLQHSNVRHCVLLFIDNIWANLFITVYLIHFLQVAGVLLTMKKFMFILTHILWFLMHGVYWWNKYFSSKIFYQHYQSIIKRNSNISTIRKWMSSSINIQMKCEKMFLLGVFISKSFISYEMFWKFDSIYKYLRLLPEVLFIW